MEGLLDIGAEKSIINSKSWPKNWPVDSASTQLVGLGHANLPKCSAKMLTWKDEEGTQESSSLTFFLKHVNLWRRDVLAAMDVVLATSYPKAFSQIVQQGYIPGKGLGKLLQDKIEPVKQSGNASRQGLGYQHL